MPQSMMCHLQAFLPIWFNRFTAKTNPGNTYTLGGMSDSYYEYLLKVWLLKGKQVCTASRCRIASPRHVHSSCSCMSSGCSSICATDGS